MHSYFSIEAFEQLQPYWQLHYFPETDSTNEQSKLAIQRELTHNNTFRSGSIFLADHQNKGKGRRDNVWSSSPGEDLLFTAVIETEIPLDQIHKIATASALALVKSFASLSPSLSTEIKFPNDVYLGGKKCAGILIEQVKQFTLIGIGINVNSLPQLENSTSLIQQLGSPVCREKLLAKVLDQLLTKISLCKADYTTIQSQITPYDFFFDKTIQFKQDSVTHIGTAKGLSPNGYILVDTYNGEGPREIQSGHSFRVI